MCVCACVCVQEASLYEKLHPPELVCVVHAASRGRAGQGHVALLRWWDHRLQHAAVTGETSGPLLVSESAQYSSNCVNLVWILWTFVQFMFMSYGICRIYGAICTQSLSAYKNILIKFKGRNITVTIQTEFIWTLEHQRPLVAGSILRLPGVRLDYIIFSWK